jgi:hypothetical protein
MDQLANWLPALAVGGVVLVALVMLWAGHAFKWSWTGFRASARQSQPCATQSKTLWDWMQLIFVPLILACVAWSFNLQQQNMSLSASTDQDRETVLNTYIDQTSALVLLYGQTQVMTDTMLQAIARARTVAALQRLDGPRKGMLLRFLHEANLLHNPTRKQPGPALYLGPNVDLSAMAVDRAFLSNDDFDHAYMPNASLVDAHLSDANLNWATLTRGTLAMIYAPGVHLNGAHLAGANLRSACLRNASLSGADLSGADLTGANLVRADLTSADLAGVDLTRARFTGKALDGTVVVARLTPTQMAQANATTSRGVYRRHGLVITLGGAR